MKLLMVAIVIIATISAVHHLSDAAQKGSSLTRNLRSEVGPIPVKKFQMYFDDRLRRLFAEGEKNAMSEEAFNKLMESPLLEENARLWKEVNLLRRPAFLKWISENMKDKDRVRLVYEMVHERNRQTIRTLSIINAGKMADNKEVRSFAYSLEGYMLNLWYRDPEKRTIPEAFVFLGLHKMKKLDDLCLNPFFTTWLSYAIKHDKWEDTVISEIDKSFTPEMGRRTKENFRSKLPDLKKKIDQLILKRNSWHEALQPKATNNP